MRLHVAVDYGQVHALLSLLILVAVHSIRLARASLSVAKDGRMEALNDVLDHAVHVCSVINLLLRSLRLEHLVESEAARLTAAVALSGHTIHDIREGARRQMNQKNHQLKRVRNLLDGTLVR